MPDDFDLDPAPEVWARLRAYLALSTSSNGEPWREPPVPYPPASERQLRETEAVLGFPMPQELRQFYASVANGGRNLGFADVLHGAVGGCPEHGVVGGATIERLVSHSGWRLHPRIEEALLCHPGRSVIGDSLPDRFLHLGEDENYGISTVLDSVTGRVYDFDYFTTVQPTDGPEQNVYWLVLRAPSLSAWFAHWLDNVTGHERAHCWPFDPGDLMPEQVATADLLDPNQVWRGIYHFGLDWEQVKPVEASIVEDINQSVYRSNKDDFRSMQES